MYQRQVQYRFEWPRLGPALKAIIIANVAVYVLQLIIRAIGGPESLGHLTPALVFEKGYVWQPFTYWWMHSPLRPGHIIMNMLLLYFFGARMESRWGPRRFVRGYVAFGLAGAALVLITSLLGLLILSEPTAGAWWRSSHVGASGAVMGIIVAFGLTYPDEEVSLFFLLRIKAKYLVLLLVGLDLVSVVLDSPVSVASHLGGMIMAVVLVWGLWRPSRARDLVTRSWRRFKLRRRMRDIEHQLRVLEGGKKPPAKDDPSKWN